MHAASPSSERMERLFIYFSGQLVRSKRGNIAILVVVDPFSKFVTFYPVRQIISLLVIYCLDRGFFAGILTTKTEVHPTL
jgi:hypothetical protein